MLTEEEALTKECRVGGISPRTGKFPMCIASQCMSWKWLQLPLGAYNSPVNGKQIAGPVEGKGDCGLKR